MEEFQEIYALRRTLERAAKDVLGHPGWHVSAFVYDAICKREGFICMERIDKTERYFKFSFDLPTRVPETNLFPSEKLLQFMDIGKVPTKRAKPRDWIALAEKFAADAKAEYELKANK